MSRTIIRYSTPIDNLAVDPEYCQRAPKLSEVLSGNSSAPWTLASFRSYVASQFCSENLDFNDEVFVYRDLYAQLSLSGPSKGLEERLHEKWFDIMEIYIRPNSAREINLPGLVRSRIIQVDAASAGYKHPDLLIPAYTHLYELTNGIFIQWASTVRPADSRLCVADCKNFSSSSPIIELCPQFPEENMSLYKRAHGIWGNSRVYRKIRGPKKPAE